MLQRAGVVFPGDGDGAVLRQHQPWLQWHGIGTDISFEAINRRHSRPAIARGGATYPGGLPQAVSAENNRAVADFRQRSGARHIFFTVICCMSTVPPLLTFNIIFCQNVLIYFEREKQRWIIDQLVDRCARGLADPGCGGRCSLAESRYAPGAVARRMCIQENWRLN